MAVGEFEDPHQFAALLGLDLPPLAAPDIEQQMAVGTNYGIENVRPRVQLEDTPTA